MRKIQECWQYRSLPRERKNSKATLQRIVSNILGGRKDVDALLFRDDASIRTFRDKTN